MRRRRERVGFASRPGCAYSPVAASISPFDNPSQTVTFRDATPPVTEGQIWRLVLCAPSAAPYRSANTRVIIVGSAGDARDACRPPTPAVRSHQPSRGYDRLSTWSMHRVDQEEASSMSKVTGDRPADDNSTLRMDSKPHTSRAPHSQGERHRGVRAGWLRAAVLGADDGIVSVASLSIGVVATGASRTAVLAASVAALVAGAKIGRAHV